MTIDDDRFGLKELHKTNKPLKSDQMTNRGEVAKPPEVEVPHFLQRIFRCCRSLSKIDRFYLS